jgi:endonuclease YncB( thermonuclease family)
LDETCISSPLVGLNASNRLKAGARLRTVIKLIFLLLCLAGNSAQSSVAFGGVVSFVTDGDTLWVQPDRGGATQKLRILGIDAPEICQVGGEASRSALIQLALRQRVSVTVTRKDVYGRGLARIYLGNQDLGAQMVKSGQAWSYRWQKSPGPYAREQALAQQLQLGVFSGGRAVNPKDFRRRHGSCHVARAS